MIAIMSDTNIQRRMSVDSDTLLLSDDDSLKSNPNISNNSEPSMAHLMSFFLRMDKKLDRQFDDNQKAHGLVKERMSKLEAKTDTALERIAKIEERLEKAGTATVGGDSVPEEWAKQNELRMNVSVVGVPPSRNENLRTIMIDLCRFFGIAVAEVDLPAVYRVGSSKSNMFIVKFSSLQLKLKLMAAKSSKNVVLSDIKSISCSSVMSNNGIFINPHMTPAVGRLMFHGRMAKRENKLHKCWLGANGVMIQMTPDSEVVTVVSLDALKGLLGTPPDEPLLEETFKGKRRALNDSLSPNNQRPPRRKQKTATNNRATGPKSVKERLSAKTLAQKQ